MLANLRSPGVTLHPVNQRSTSSTQRPSPLSPKSSPLPLPPLATRPSLPRTTSLPPRPHGLALDPSSFPLLDSTSPIRTLSASQFAQVHRRYADTIVDEGVLFPWLHAGAEVPDSCASRYFGFGRGEAAEVPCYRGLTTLHAHAHSPPSPSSSSSSSLSSLLNSHSILVSSLPSTTVLSPHKTFNHPLPSTTVSLRTFSHQPAKYASVSDIVVYGPDGADEEVVELAKGCVEAIEVEWCRRGKTGERYNVFVVTDPFSSFEKHYPHLVAIDSDGFARNKLDFHEREREEMRVLTEASEIAPNIFLGNIGDLPLDHPDGNPMAFAICVEAHDSALLADAPTLRAHASFLDELEDESLATLSSSSDSLSSSSLILTPHAADVVHLSCLSTTSYLTASSRTTFLHQIVALAVWLRDQATPPTRFGRLSRRVLLYCGDGYSETSLLALTCVMLERRCNAPEAYLFLQLEAERSFFVYPRDVEMVIAVEQRVKEVLEREDREAKVGGESMARSDSGFVEGPEMEERREKTVLPRMRLSTPVTEPWFYAPTFEGHFPSRILPSLYLGNLAHATNALMLRSLGITHVVSMGESALTPPSQSFSSLSLTPNSLWHEERLGNISVLDMQNLADDGMDSIRPYIDQALEYMEDARRSGGKVLVHCRVGVSRSATIVIAYLMKHVQLDLASAYLLTRSRRLNILIQPNLPFAATLHAFEAELIMEKESREEEEEEEEQLGRAGLKRSNRLAWSSLSHEIALLNERFSC